MSKSQMSKEYPLSRDYVDFNRYVEYLFQNDRACLIMNRLNLQHYIWKDMFGYSLHPKIPRNQKSLKVADVGTGTGYTYLRQNNMEPTLTISRIWLLDLLPQLDPSTELVGIDADITQVGPREWLPENLTLRQWSVFTDVPDDLVGAFDIVNLRLFAFVVEDDATPILQKLKKLLSEFPLCAIEMRTDTSPEPGGYLQWCEVDVLSFRINTASPDVSTHYLVQLWEQTMPKEARLFPTWVKGLPESLGRHKRVIQALRCTGATCLYTRCSLTG
jgi:hypothetical protein